MGQAGERSKCPRLKDWQPISQCQGQCLFLQTKPKPAQSRQGLAGGTVGSRYNSSGYILWWCQHLASGLRRRVKMNVYNERYVLPTCDRESVPSTAADLHPDPLQKISSRPSAQLRQFIRGRSSNSVEVQVKEYFQVEGSLSTGLADLAGMQLWTHAERSQM